MSSRWTRSIRQFGALVMGVVGFSSGDVVWAYLEKQPGFPDAPPSFSLLVSVSLGLFGLGIGYLVAPLLLRPLEALYESVSHVAPVRLVASAIGLGIGLSLGAMASLPLSMLHPPLGQLLPFITALTLAYLGAAAVGSNPSAFLSLLRSILGRGDDGTRAPSEYILLDTSVLIDARIADVVETGFVDKTLLVPRFVLEELQLVADSSDALRRNRGRRGLEVVNRLQHSEKVNVEITNQDTPGMGDVDKKLVRLAERLNASIMTNDFNLNRVADIQGIRVLNLNELANAVKTLVLPGETLRVQIIQEGKEQGQGVAYLEDGTMVVVEEGSAQLGQRVDVRVNRVLQTVAGRMIFGAMEHASAEPATV